MKRVRAVNILKVIKVNVPKGATVVVKRGHLITSALIGPCVIEYFPPENDDKERQ